jgi:hypothetical protein
MQTQKVTRSSARRQAESSVFDEQNAFMDSSTIEEEATVHSINVNLDDECACCHRCKTVLYALELKEVNIVTRRSFGEKDLPVVANLCAECSQYLRTRHQTPQWVHAWPAVLFPFLTSETFSFDSKKLAEIIP